MREVKGPAGSPALATLWLAGRFFRRDIRSAQFLVIGLAVVIAVASITAVSTFTARVRGALDEQSHALLAADLAVVSSEALAPKLTELARAGGLRTARFLTLRTMLSAGENLQLGELKAVDAGYPLRGSLIVRDTVDGVDHVATALPAPGEVWVDARLPGLLGVTLGAKIGIGEASFTLTRLLLLEPDRAGEFFALAPRVLINLESLPATRLIAPGSRVQHSLLLAGPRAALAAFRSTAPLDRHARFLSPADARPEIRAALTHAEQFLGLAALTATTLAGIAILLAARSYAGERLDTVALLRTFGASRRQVLLLVIGELVLLALTASALGAGLGYGAQNILAAALRGWTQGVLPPPGWAGVARGFMAGVIAVAGFGLAPLVALRQVPPARILRQDTQVPGTRPLVSGVYALVALVLLAPWDSGDWRLTAWALLGFGGVLCLLAGAGLGLVTLLGALRGQAGIAWRSGLANLARRRHQSVWQITALGLGIMALLLLGLLRSDLLLRWQETLPASTPDQFLVNIQPAQVAALQAFFTTHQLPETALYPMVRGRLVAIAGRPVGPDTYPDPRAKRLVDREFNLSWSHAVRADNRIVAGSFWGAAAGPQFSVEVELAKRLGIKLGDKLRFSIADQEVEASVTSLREVAWDSMQVNFFVVSPVSLLGHQPTTFITSFRLPPDHPTLLRELVGVFPNITVIDVGALLAQVRNIMARVADAVQFVFLFTLAAGVIVLVAALRATQADRIYDAVILKTLGAPRRLIASAVAIEFAAVGLCAGLVGGVGAGFGGWLIARQVLHIEYVVQPAVIGWGILAGLAAIVAVGLYAVLGALREPVSTALRKL
ncbi:MAG: FtsX-like permease family protein [Gammaproteobacteria bacterium]|nr:FtsX-like permease family protein [Gammaproteobacteria bacterium]